MVGARLAGYCAADRLSEQGHEDVVMAADKVRAGASGNAGSDNFRRNPVHENFDPLPWTVCGSKHDPTVRYALDGSSQPPQSPHSHMSRCRRRNRSRCHPRRPSQPCWNRAPWLASRTWNRDATAKEALADGPRCPSCCAMSGVSHDSVEEDREVTFKPKKPHLHADATARRMGRTATLLRPRRPRPRTPHRRSPPRGGPHRRAPRPHRITPRRITEQIHHSKGLDRGMPIASVHSPTTQQPDDSPTEGQCHTSTCPPTRPARHASGRRCGIYTPAEAELPEEVHQ